MVSCITEPLIRSRSGALIASLGFSTTATGVLLISVPLELRQLHATPNETGFTLAMFGFGMFACEWLWGVVADRFGYGGPMVASQLLYAVCIVLLAQAGSVPLIAGAYFLACGAMVAGGPIPRSYVGTAVRVELRATGLALLASQWVVAEAVGAGVGGALIDRFPIRSVMLASAALPLLSAVLVALVFRGHVRPDHGERVVDRRAGATREPARLLPVLAITAALALLIQVGLGGELALLPLLVTGHLGLQASAAGFAMLAVGLVGGLLLVPGGRVADLWGRRPAMVAGAAISAGGYVIYAIAGGLGFVLAGAVVRAIGASLIWPAVTAWVAESVPRRRHAFYMGLFGEFENVGVTVGPLIGGLAWSVAGLPSAFYLYAAAATLAAVVAAFGVQRLSRLPTTQADRLAQDLSRR